MRIDVLRLYKKSFNKYIVYLITNIIKSFFIIELNIPS